MIDASSIALAARRRAGLTQRDLAARLGVSQPVVARLERPGSNPTVSTLAGLVAATGHSLRIDLDQRSGIDESMVAADLRRTPDERMRAFESFYGFAKDAGGAAI